MPGPITLRNLTPQPLTVKLVERYEAPSPDKFPPNAGFSVNNLTQNFTSLLKENKGPSHAELGDKAQSFKKEDVDVRMEPFTTHRTEIKLTERGPNEILRLTFQGDGGGSWRIDTPSPTPASQVLVPLSPNPAHEYTAVYNAESSFLALFESTALQSWMAPFADSTQISALSLPGTHNSPTCHKALPSVRCQAVSPREQLENGVRFFDIRVQVENPDDAKSDALQLVHAVFPISLTGPKKFRPLVAEVLDFLKQNPSETVVMSLKREGTGKGTDQQLSNILKDHYTNPQEWFTQPHIPTLAEARGKIVLVRRFALADRLNQEWGGKGWGIFALNWADNTPNNRCGDIQVQDFYEVLETENIDKKLKFCCEHLERAGAECYALTANPPPPSAGLLYINFLSASNFWKAGCWPDRIAAKLNPAIVTHLCEKHGVGDRGLDGPGQEFKGDGGTGVVVTDWVGKDGDWDLVRCIVGMNGRLLLRQTGKGWR